jgi:hypothetical protein
VAPPTNPEIVALVADALAILITLVYAPLDNPV